MPEKLELTLEECRALALENNLDLKIQLINPAIAAERISQEEARFESTFNSGISYSNSNSPSANYVQQITGSKSESSTANLGVQMPLKTGGTLSLDMLDSKRKSDELSKIDSKTIKHRCLKLQKLSDIKNHSFYKSNIGKTSNVLFEAVMDKGNIFGFTDNYLKVEHPTMDGLINEIKKVRLDKIVENNLISVKLI